MVLPTDVQLLAVLPHAHYLCKRMEASAILPDGSRKWLFNFITNPAHPDLYGERNDRMPKFGEAQILSGQQIGLVADWLHGNWYEPNGTVETSKR